MENVSNVHEIRNIEGFDKNILSGTHLDFFGEDFRTELNPSKYYIHLYKEIPFVFTAFSNISLISFLNHLTKKYNLADKDYILKYEYSKNKKIDKVDYDHSSYFIRLKDYLLIEAHSYKIVFYYSTKIDQSEIKGILDSIKDNKMKRRYNRRFYMVATSTRTEHGFELMKYITKKTDIKIEENYNSDFIEVDELINAFLKENNTNGVVLLHGKFGTGKTTYLRYIMTKINKRFIFLPIDLMDSISSPSFLPFISKFKNSVLILEDCEEVLMHRGTKGSTNSLINLLNLGDGLLSDALSIKIICTFNADLKQIDQALLRKGRLVARYEFKELEVTKAQSISDKLGKEEIIKEPMTLAEIYNLQKKDFSKSDKKKIGF